MIILSTSNTIAKGSNIGIIIKSTIRVASHEFVFPNIVVTRKTVKSNICNFNNKKQIQ